MQNNNTLKWPLDRVERVDVLLNFTTITYLKSGRYWINADEYEATYRGSDEEMSELLDKYETAGCFVMPLIEEAPPPLLAEKRIYYQSANFPGYIPVEAMSFDITHERGGYITKAERDGASDYWKFSVVNGESHTTKQIPEDVCIQHILKVLDRDSDYVLWFYDGDGYVL